MPDVALFEQLTAEAVRPLRITCGRGEWTVTAPLSDGVQFLDQVAQPAHRLVTLLGEHVAGPLLEELSYRSHGATAATVRGIRAHFHLHLHPGLSWAETVHTVNTYGQAVEADLFDRGFDLLDFFRGVRPWPQLRRWTAELPDGSRYKAALLGDEQLARYRLEHGMESERADRPPLVGETPERAMLRELVNSSRHNSWATFAAQNGKKAGRPPKPLKHPQSAEERLGMEYAKRTVEDIFDQATPWWRDSDPLAGQDPATDQPVD